MKRKARFNGLMLVLFFLVSMLVISSVTTVPADEREAADAIGRAFDLRVALKSKDTGRLVRNSVIDCSTNKTYRSGTYADYVHSVGHSKIASDCRSCHRAARPTVGVGDRPTPRFASFALANYTDKPQKYSLTAGSKGEWTEITLEPNKLKTFSWKYENLRDRRSPVYWIHFAGKTHRVVPLATPNENLGSFYYVVTDKHSKEARFLSARQPLRGR